ncbi:MAG: GNAT family N-acetyltransferase [Bacteroidales bacterium]|nr:GNAT family N-acetyltransferase [Bacteroidales bacterium]MBN2697348.1 GNAT family N-acetyltransferase [Bacteroidales bacterium]
MNLLQNKEIELRAPEPEDLETLYLWENDPSVWHVSNTLVPVSRYVLKKYLEEAGKDIYEMKQLRLMIQKTENKEPVGAIDLFEYDPFHNRAGIGILIAAPQDRKKGYARQSVETLIKYCFEVLDLHQLFCNVARDNEESLNLFTNAGFVITGIKQDWLKREHKYVDELMLQLINPVHHNKEGH